MAKKREQSVGLWEASPHRVPVVRAGEAILRCKAIFDGKLFVCCISSGAVIGSSIVMSAKWQAHDDVRRSSGEAECGINETYTRQVYTAFEATPTAGIQPTEKLP